MGKTLILKYWEQQAKMALQDTRFWEKKKVAWKKRLFRGRNGPRGSSEERKAHRRGRDTVKYQEG